MSPLLPYPNQAHAVAHHAPARAVLRLLPALAALLAFTGCEEVVDTRSLVDTLKIVAIEVDPPEVYPDLFQRGQTIQVTVASADAPDARLEYAVILCTAYEFVSGCLEFIDLVTEEDLENGTLSLDEEDYRRFVERFVITGTTTADGLTAEIEVPFQVPVNEYYLLTELEDPPSLIDGNVSVLVCREGLCPILDEIDAYQAEDPSAPTGEDLITRLSTPEGILSGLPLDGVALGLKSYWVRAQEDESNRNHNPLLTGLYLDGCDEAELEPDPADRHCVVTATVDPDSLEIYYPRPGDTTVTTQEAVVLRFYTTAGEVRPYTVQVLPSASPVQSAVLYLPPAGEMPPEIAVYVVAADSRNGMDSRFETWTP